MIARFLYALRMIWTAFGLTSFCAAIWFGLPLLGREELAGFELRLGLISLVLICYSVVSISQERARRKSANALERNLTAVQGAPDDSKVLSERMHEAVTRLKSSRGASSLYDLPWYVIIGPPGAGKTTALVHSGLAFPGTKPSSVSGVGGTRNCDFWFSEEAVLIDTAGRYTTQDSDAQSDSASWAAFLQELKGARADQPINGILLAFSCDDMMRGNDVSLAAHAAAVRARLSELNETLQVQVPVYAIFTKADLVSGFREYFGKLSAQARKDVWGITFQTNDPQEQTHENVGQEFDRLVARLSDQMPARMADEKDTSTRHTLMRFPEQMSAMKDNMELFLRLIFQEKGAAQAVLRGFYFTSGTQAGTPFDQILGAMVDTQDSGVGDFLSGRGRSYFLHDLLREVIFPERGWVGYDRRRVRGRRIRRGLGISIVAAAALAGIVLLGMSFWYNATLVRIAERQSQRYEASAANILAETVVVEPKTRDLRSALALVRTLPAGYIDRTNDGWMNQLGLSRRDAVRGATLTAYSDALERMLRPRMMVLLEQDLARAVAEDNPRDAFDALRVYLLVSKTQEGSEDDLAIQRYFATAWATEYRGDDKGYRDINLHLAAMLDLDGRARIQVPPSASVVGDIRDALAGLSDAEVVFVSQQGQGGVLPVLRPFAKIGAEDGLRASDGRVLGTLEVDPLLTPEGYDRVVKDVIASASDILQREAWVLGRNGVASVDLSQEVTEIYLREVVQAWDSLLWRIEPASAPSKQALGEAVVSVVEAARRGLTFSSNELEINGNTDFQRWQSLLSDPPRLARFEQDVTAIVDAPDLPSLQQVLNRSTERAAYPAQLQGLLLRVVEAVRLGLPVEQ